MKRFQGKNLKIFLRKCSLSPVSEKCRFPWKKPLFCHSDVFHRKTPTPTRLRRSERRKQRLSHPKWCSFEGIAHPHLKIAAYHYLSYVKFILRHGLSYDKMHRKNRRPDFVRGGGFIMQGFANILPHSDTAEGEHNVPDVLGMRRPCVRAALLRAKRTARRKSCLSLFSNFSYSYLTSM